MRSFDLAPALIGLSALAGAAASDARPAERAAHRVAPHVTPAPLPQTSPSVSPGRDQDARAARIAFRLATAGVKRCPAARPALGLVLQHLTQFEPADRAGLIAANALDRGPGVVVVVPSSPAAAAGVRAGDVLLAIDGAALPREEGLTLAFAAAVAHARADAVLDLLDRGATTFTLLRDRTTITARVAPLPACPSRVHLARSGQRNAYADGRHVLLTTGLVSQLAGDDELAFVIAHEMAHNVLGHASVMRSAAVRGGIGRSLGSSGRIVRGTEDAADALGGALMLDAGFDPVAGAGLLRRFGGGGLDLFGTHASATARIAAMEALARARTAP